MRKTKNSTMTTATNTIGWTKAAQTTGLNYAAKVTNNPGLKSVSSKMGIFGAAATSSLDILASKDEEGLAQAIGTNAMQNFVGIVVGSAVTLTGFGLLAPIGYQIGYNLSEDISDAIWNGIEEALNNNNTSNFSIVNNAVDMASYAAIDALANEGLYSNNNATDSKANRNDNNKSLSDSKNLSKENSHDTSFTGDRGTQTSGNSATNAGGGTGPGGSSENSRGNQGGKSAGGVASAGKGMTGSRGTQSTDNSSTNAGGNTGPGGSSENSRGNQSFSNSRGGSFTGSRGTQTSGNQSTNSGGRGPGGSCENSRGNQGGKSSSASESSANESGSGKGADAGESSSPGCSSDGHFGRPIIMDLDGDGVELVSLKDSSAYYDIDGDGTRNRIGWAGSDDGLLAYDINGDMDISKKDEISFVDYVKGAKTDLEGLHYFDTNKDGVLDKKDKEFGKFGIWQDKNQNGITDQGEFKSLDKVGIDSIDLKSDNKKEVVEGNRVAGYGKYTLKNGTSLKFSDTALKYSKTEVKPGIKDGAKEKSSEFRSIAYRDYTGLKSTSLLNKINNTPFSANGIEIFAA